jgi:hypothetical protein
MKIIINDAFERLHGYYQPAPPSWIPHTLGWYVLFTLVALLLLQLVVRMFRCWFKDHYRRKAIEELATATPDQFSALLKRTALCVWPRAKVASLSGDAWISFLNKTTKRNLFHNAPGNRIEEISLRNKLVSAEDEQTLRTLAAEWIRRHRVQA